MAKVFRACGNALIWVLAVAGVASGLVWGATRLGWVQPLVVVSGSMSPGIATGDLVVDRPTPTGQLAVGDVASIRSAMTGRIVTHRVVAVEPQPDETWAVTLKGDANDAPDAEVYLVGGTVWTPVLRVPGGGAAIVTLTRPSVAGPLAVTLLALAGLTLLSRRGEGADVVDDEPKAAIA